jgi:hypothetical protein
MTNLNLLLLLLFTSFISTISHRVISIGDLHGNYQNTIKLLKMNQLIEDEKNPKWTGKDSKLIQIGDILDRGPDSIAVLELLQQLQNQAPNFNGEVILLLGNHV